MRRLGAFAPILALCVGACSANHHSIYRSKPFADDTLVTVDAKQRAIVRKGGKICTEPSPDVFAVLAQSFSGDASLEKSADPTALGIGLAAAYTSAEQASTIARTQTINMLREAMYNTCIRSLNGQINELEMPIQAARDQRMMVSTLAIEQITGAVAPRPVIIGASGSASRSGGGTESVVRLDDAFQKLTKSRSDEATKQTTLDSIKDQEPTCAALDTKVAQGMTIEDAAEIEKQKKCSEAKSALTKASAERQAAEQHYAALKEAAAKSGADLSAQTKVMEPGDTADLARAAAASHVADVVERIVAQTFKQTRRSSFASECFPRSQAATPQKP